MPAVYPAPITRIQGETLALSTTLASLGIPPNSVQALVYSPTSDFRLHLNPAIVGVRFYDASATAGSRFLNAGLHINLTDRDTGTGTGTLMNSMTTSDYLYVCFAAPVAGMRVTVGNTNSTASTLAGGYYSGAQTFTALSLTDNTESPGGTTLGASGTVTWTAVTDWVSSSLGDAFALSSADRKEAESVGVSGFWARFSVGTALDATVSLTELWALNNDTNRGYFRSATEYGFSLDRRLVGSIEAILAAGSVTAEITWVRTVA